MQFTKMQGVGNDFVVVDAAALAGGVCLPELALKTCDRDVIGADGLLVVSQEPDTETAFRMRMFNPDGTEDMCGNGLRCVSLWAYRAGWLGGQTQFTVAALEGPRRVEMLSAGEDGRTAEFSVDMGRPLIAPELLPVMDSEDLPDQIIRFPLVVGDAKIYEITVVNTGSTHTVIFGPPPSEEVFQRVSPLIENDALFPERTSVLWATPRDPQTMDIRIWERGAGETLGCGTGACAVGVAAVLNHLAAPNTPLDIVSKGGTLRITWPGVDASVDMVGPAQIVYWGEFKDA